MITDWLDQKATGAQLNGRLVYLLRTLYAPQTELNIRQLLDRNIQAGDQFNFIPLNSTTPPTMVIWDNQKTLVLCGGTSGQIHVPELLAGWNNVTGGPFASMGICPAFADAARYIIDHTNPEAFALKDRIYYAGHSYGGACMQALACVLFPQTVNATKCWSYGSPRPGNQTMQTFMRRFQNTRFFADNDPVRFIPPHSNEVPSLTALDTWSLVRGCNTQVQSPTGYELQEDGTIVQTEGNPTVLHAVALSVISWCMDANGFRSVNHALSNYQERFTKAEAFDFTPFVGGPPVKPEEPLVITIRERERIEAQGEIDIAADLALPFPTLNDYAVPSGGTTPGPLRYKRRKVGRVWGVKFGDEVVAIGPGKRVAGRLARSFNRAAFRTR